MSIRDGVKMTSTSTGTGSFFLDAAATGYRTFATAFAGDWALSSIAGSELVYRIESSSGSQWEVGIGYITKSSGQTLLRQSVLSNSSGNTSLVNFSAGAKVVMLVNACEPRFHMIGHKSHAASDRIDAYAFNAGRTEAHDSVAEGWRSILTSDQAGVRQRQTLTTVGSISFELEGSTAAGAGTTALTRVSGQSSATSTPMIDFKGWLTTNPGDVAQGYALWGVHALVVCWRPNWVSGGGAPSALTGGMWRVEGLIHGSGGSNEVAGTPLVTQISNTLGASPTLALASSQNFLTVTGISGQALIWGARVEVVKLKSYTP